MKRLRLLEPFLTESSNGPTVFYPYKDLNGAVISVRLKISKDGVRIALPPAIPITHIPPELIRMAQADAEYAKTHEISEFRKYVGDPEWRGRLKGMMNAVRVPEGNLNKPTRLAGGGMMRVEYTPCWAEQNIYDGKVSVHSQTGMTAKYDFWHMGAQYSLCWTFSLYVRSGIEPKEAHSPNIPDQTCIPKELIALIRRDFDIIEKHGANALWERVGGHYRSK